MSRFLASIFLGLVIGAGLGLFWGWMVDPVEYRNSPASNLARQHQDEYTIMVAAGYLNDNDPSSAVARLRILGVENVPAYVQEVAERYITDSRDFEDIQYLVALAEGLGRLTPVMEQYRMVGGTGNG